MPRQANPQRPLPLDRDRRGAHPNPYGQVLLTYLKRPAFHVLAIALATSLGFLWLIDHLNRIYWFLSSSWVFSVWNSLLWVLLVMLSNLAPLALSVILTAMLIAQTREHLLGWRASIFPGYRQPHVVAATLILALVSVSVAAAFCATSLIGDPRSFPEMLAGITTLVTFMAWTGVRRSPVLVPVGVLLLLLLSVEPHALQIAFIASRFFGGFREPRGLSLARARWPVCLLLTAGEFLLLPILLRAPRERAARGSAIRQRLISAFSRLPCNRRFHNPFSGAACGPFASSPSGAETGSKTPPARNALTTGAHRTVVGVWHRAWHRRRAVLPPRAAVWIASALCAILLFTSLLSAGDRVQTCVLRGLLLATLTPGIVAAGIWRERWPVLGFESLFPGRRRDFVRETAVAMAINVAEVWLASAVAAVAAIAPFQPEQLMFWNDAELA